MASYNKVILLGNLVADPELKQTSNGIAVTSFRIAVGRRFSKQNEAAQQADFIDIVCWRQTAEYVTRYGSKGRSLLVSGSLQTRSWTDNNGQKRYSTEVVAEEVTFVDRRPDGQSATGAPADMNAEPAPYSANPKEVVFEELSADDDLPF